MGIEIERKFLVVGDAWREGVAGERMAQGYLCSDPERTVRVRVAGETGWLTIKGRGDGIARPEFEYEIPVSEARELLGLCMETVIDKTRYRVRHGGHLWEVDVFHGANEGLVVAEVELETADEGVDLPPWVGAEVSEDRRYANSSLAKVAFSAW